MNSIASISTSGMQAAQARLSVSANNIANAQTEGYQREEVVQQAVPNGGVTATATTQNSLDAQQNLEQDVVQQLQSKNAFLANLSVFRSGNQMLGTLLNTQA